MASDKKDRLILDILKLELTFTILIELFQLVGKYMGALKTWLMTKKIR